jgi:hypothetical protein
MCLQVSYKKKIWEKFFLASLKSLKKGVGSGLDPDPDSLVKRYGSADPVPHQNVTDPQHFSSPWQLQCLVRFSKTVWFIRNISAEAGKQKKVKSPPGVEEERSASKRRRNSSASSDNPVQGKQKFAFLDYLKTRVSVPDPLCSGQVWLSWIQIRIQLRWNWLNWVFVNFRDHFLLIYTFLSNIKRNKFEKDKGIEKDKRKGDM